MPRLGIRRPRVAGMPAGPLVKASMPTSLPGGLALPSGSSIADSSALIGMLQGRTGQAVNGAVPLPRDAQTFAALFGPGSPLYASPFNTPNPRTGQADPRQTEYPVSYNITAPDRPVPWSTLRAAADKVDIIRLCLRTRKDELCQLEWGFGFTTDAEQQLGITSAAAKRDMRTEYATQLARLKDFWSIPDKTNDLSWSEWLGMLLEERFVLDASTIYPRLTYGGDLASLEVIDGSTIKPLIDSYGNRPAPPAPAYQQWLYGFPRGEYTDDGASDTWEGTAGSLIYKPYTRRTQSPFGYPEVEQALVSAEVYLRRQDWMRKEYTAGSLPRTMLEMDAMAGSITPEQRRAWQIVLNDELSGDTATRQGAFTLLPGGFKPVVNADVAERYKADYDEFLVKLLCAHMATQPSEIGFTPSNGLGGAGFSDAQEDVTYRKSLRPTLSWLIDIVNQVSRQYLDMPPELTFQFLGMESEDEAAADTVAQTRVSNGRMTLNEDRDRCGLPRYDFDEADKPMLMTGRGMVFIEGAAANAQPGVEVSPPTAAPTGAAPPVPPDGSAAPPDTESDESGTDSGQPQAKAGASTDTAKTELAAFARFLTKRGKLTRPFAFTSLAKADADVLNATAAVDPEWAAEWAADIVKVGPGGWSHGWVRDGGLPAASPAPSPAPVHAPGLQDDRGRRVELTAAHKKAVKAAKLSTQQQMEYMARRFNGASHEDALAGAKLTPRKADGSIFESADDLLKRWNPLDHPRGKGGLFSSVPNVFSVGGTRLTAARLGPASISAEETKRQVAGFMDDHPELFTRGAHVGVHDHKGQKRLVRAGTALALAATLSGFTGSSSGDEEHAEIPDAGPAAVEMYNQFHGVDDKDDPMYLRDWMATAATKAAKAAHKVVGHSAGHAVVRLEKDWADLDEGEREAFLDDVVGDEPKDTTKADSGGAGGRGGAPEGARRGDRPGDAGYPIRPEGTG